MVVSFQLCFRNWDVSLEAQVCVQVFVQIAVDVLF